MNTRFSRTSVFALTAALVAVLGSSGCDTPADAIAQGATGQQQVVPPTQSSPGDTIQLVFEREVFRYPSFQRRNPFAPLTGAGDGPRYEELVLRMVILVDDGPGSVATLAMRGAGGQTFRVREGDILGNMRIQTIRLREVVVDVDEFGQRDRRIIELSRAEPEATGTDGRSEPPPPNYTPPGGGSTPPSVTPPDTTAGNRNGGSE